MKSKKGFTLVELMVTMAISVIVGALVFAVSMMVSDYVTRSQDVYDINKELNTFSDNLTNVFEDYQSSDFTILSSSGQITFHSTSEDVVLSFVDGKLLKDDEVLQNCNYISDLEFEMQGSLVKCIATYCGNLKYIVLLNKRV